MCLQERKPARHPAGLEIRRDAWRTCVLEKLKKSALWTYGTPFLGFQPVFNHTGRTFFYDLLKRFIVFSYVKKFFFEKSLIVSFLAENIDLKYWYIMR